MKKLYFLAALVGVWGCRAVQQESGVPITFTPTEQTPSRSNVLVAGDIVGVFAAVEGTENYFLENAKYVVGSDGRSLSTSPAVYYPEAKQAVVFTAYLPLGGTWSGTVGTFSVPADQSTTLKQADLCWAKASSTPVATAVPLEFNHKMARLLITTNTPTTKIAIPNAFSGGTLDIKTGVFTPIQRSSISTTGNELILPAQTVTRLILTVAGVEYVFEGAISLESAKTTTVNLTLNPSTKTATLSGSSTTNWAASAKSDLGNPSVSNTLRFHFPNSSTLITSVNKVVLQVKDLNSNTTAEYTATSGIVHTNGTLSVPVVAPTLHYPCTILSVWYYNNTVEILSMSNAFVGPTLYKQGSYSIGVLRNLYNPPSASDYVIINGIKWAKGNLIAAQATASNLGGCKIGTPTDAGLYFQAGSLIGWKGGAAANGGTGQGLYPSSWENRCWGGSTFSWANDAMVWPTSLTTFPSVWPSTEGSNISTLSHWFFNYSAGKWATTGSNIREFAELPTGAGTLGTGQYAHLGVGDPCSYYLGEPWRLPTYSELNALFNLGRSGFTSYNGTQGAWIGGSSGSIATALWFVSNGYRRIENAGGVNYTNTSGGEAGIGQCFYRTSTVYTAAYIYALWISSVHGITWLGGGTTDRQLSGAIRCVAN